MRTIIVVGLLVAVAATSIVLAPGGAAVHHVYFDSAPNGRAEIIAHGGGQGARPPNTLAALDAAVTMGADVLEIDIQQTRDGVLVLRHDATLERTTDMAGRISDLTYAEVAQADAGDNEVAGGNYSGEGIGVPTLDKAFAAHPAARWVIEIKPDTDAAAIATCEAIRKNGVGARALVASFHDAAIKVFRAACPEVATSMSRRETTRFILAAYVGLSRFLPLEAVAIQIPERSGRLQLATRRTLAATRRRGVRMQIWTVNDPDDMRRLIGLGVDGLITDHVDIMRAQLEAGAAPG